MIKKLFLGLVLLFLAIQFVRPAKNLSPMPGPQDITTKVAMPAEVQRVFAKACYDCHSDHTRYPWYAQVQPVAWVARIAHPRWPAASQFFRVRRLQRENG